MMTLRASLRTAGIACGLCMGPCVFAQDGRVVGGSATADGQFPWMVEMLFLTDQHLCGATLIHPQWVLTAGHCALVGDGADMRLIANSINNTTAAPGPMAEELLVDTIFYHPDYDGTYGPDLAMVRLAAPAITTPVVLLDPALGVVPQEGDSAVALGWGTADSVTFAMSDVLQVADVAVVDYSSCEALYVGSSTDLFGYNGTTGLICAAGFTGGAPAGSGNGDSGGPLLVEHVGLLKQVGVVYGGEEQYATATYPGVYTTVAHGWAWIQGLITAAHRWRTSGQVDHLLPGITTDTEGLVLTVPQGSGSFRTELYSTDGRLVQRLGPVGSGRRYVSWPAGHAVLLVRIMDAGGATLVSRVVPRPW
ncbi:MAG: serine protease [Flavobacteriales bacterium]|nr:serine protease [Flavobacteriales bacterium]